MIIVLEGPDGAGKSSLIEDLKKSLKSYLWTLSSNSKPSVPGEFILFSSWLDRFPKGMNLIIDRHPLISEYIYGPILRDNCIHGFDSSSLASFFEHPDILLVYCRPDKRTLMHTFFENPQRKDVEEHLNEIILRYDKLMDELENYGLSLQRYDFHRNSLQTINRIKSFIGETEDDNPPT